MQTNTSVSTSSLLSLLLQAVLPLGGILHPGQLLRFGGGAFLHPSSKCSRASTGWRIRHSSVRNSASPPSPARASPPGSSAPGTSRRRVCASRRGTSQSVPGNKHVIRCTRRKGPPRRSGCRGSTSRSSPRWYGVHAPGAFQFCPCLRSLPCATPGIVKIVP